MFFGQEFSAMPNIGYNVIAPTTLQDADDLTQLGEIQGLVSAIKHILNTRLANAGEITKRYAMELVMKLKAIYNYRWETGNTKGAKMLMTGPDRNFFIAESPHSVIIKHILSPHNTKLATAQSLVSQSCTTCIASMIPSP